MKKLLNMALAMALVVTMTACKKNTLSDEDLMDENLMAPTTVTVNIEETPSALAAGSLSTYAESDVSLGVVNFGFDMFNLTAEARGILEANAALIKTRVAEGDYAITVEGNTDEVGTIAYNIALGERRAAEVKNYYAKLGIKAANITTISYGKENPVCFESDPSCHAKNRRANTVLTVK